MLVKMYDLVFHLADLHIRRGNEQNARYEEYRDVFEGCVRAIRARAYGKKCMVVICGDVFHHKLEIAPAGIRLFYDLVHSLADMMKVLIIQGNHDLLQQRDASENNDLIEALLINNFHSNVIYLKDTGLYTFENLQFGVVSIRDILRSGASSGMVDTLPPFPTPSPSKSVFRIALAHCTVKNCMLSATQKSLEGVPVEWFAKYDVAMLGDIHLQHVVRNKRHAVTYGYPGSLVQQSFGETTFDHGFLEWIVPSSREEEPRYVRHHVPNRFGKVNAQIEMLDDLPQVFVNTHGKTPLEQFVASKDLPRQLHMRLYTNKHSAGWTERVLESIRQIAKDKTEVHVDVINAQSSERETPSSGDTELDLSELNRVDTINSFLREHMRQDVKDANPDWLSLIKDPMGFALPPKAKHPPRIAEMVGTKNEIIRSAIAKSGLQSEDSAAGGTKRFRLMTLRFGWILAFGGENVFNFESRESICLINAPNGFGKSAFFEVIILGLFGEVIPSRHNRGTSQSILNKRRLANTDSSNISVEFLLNEDRYKIRRIFQEQTDKKMVTRLQNRLVELYRNDVLIHSGAKVVSDWMRCKVCSMNDFLLFNMITQNVDMDFIKMSHKDQIEMLDSAFHINYFNHMCEMLKVVRKEYKDLERHMVTHLKAIEPTEPLSEAEDRRTEDLVRLLKENESALSECRAKLAELIVDERKFLRSQESAPEEPLEELSNRYAHLQSVLKECSAARFEPRLYPSEEPPAFFTPADERVAPLREGLEAHLEEAKSLREAVQREPPFEETEFGSIPSDSKMKDLEEELRMAKTTVDEGLLEEQPSPPTLSEAEMRDLEATLTKEVRTILRDMTAETAQQEAARFESSMEKLRASLPAPSDVEPGTDAVEKIRASVSALSLKRQNIQKEIEGIEQEHALAAGTAAEIERLNECTKQLDIQLDFDRGGFNAGCDSCNARRELKERAKRERSQNVRKRNRLVKKHPIVVQEGEGSRLERLRSKSEDYQGMIEIFEKKARERERREMLAEMDAMQLRRDLLRRFNEFNILARNLTENRTLYRSWSAYEEHRTIVLRIKALQELVRLVRERDRRASHEERLRRLRTVESLVRTTLAHRAGCVRMAGVQEELLGLESKLSFYADRKRALMSKTREHESTERETREVILMAASKKRAWEDYECAKDSMSDTLELVNRRNLLFDQVLETIKKYKAWVYNDKFLPVVVQQANEILRTLFEDRDLTLRFEFREETLCWFVQDEGNLIHVEKLSGAQAFAVGLSMRLGLGSMGISKYNCNQLFIDEGFCNFDQANLARVPTLLARLCGLFRHIVMVTHVEEIKSAAQEVVNIERGNGVSTLSAK
jgi:DNA repair exonuclease SbcCD ATPase subunit/DNA repair exonuclease SbcCD nuclease subunit